MHLYETVQLQKQMQTIIYLFIQHLFRALFTNQCSLMRYLQKNKYKYMYIYIQNYNLKCT